VRELGADGQEPPALKPTAQRVRAASVLLDRGLTAEEWAKDALASLEKPVFSV
jgi:phthalate 4,5-dioxygenase oxygenase subunit